MIIKPGENIQKLTSIRYVCSYVARWEKLKTANYVLQCYDCQGFGHSSRLCNLPRHCVKCLESHQIGHCKVSKENVASNPTCCNSNGPHLANYKNCPALLNYLRKRESTEPKPKLIPAPVPAPLNKKYSEAANSLPTETIHNNKTSNNNTETFLKLIKELLTLTYLNF